MTKTVIQFIVLFVAGRLTAAHIIVIHRRQIVVDQRIAMHHFQRDRDAQSFFLFHAEQLGALQNQKRPQTFAAGQNGISHRFDNAAFRRTRNGKQPIQFGADFNGSFFDGGK